MPTEDVTFDDIVEKTKKMLGENYRGDETEENANSEESEQTILEHVCEMVINEAAQWTNQSVKQNLTRILNDCEAVIVRCSCIAYLNRGSEGLNSQSELGQQNAYTDWVKVMHQQITNRRHVI
jgi:septin family protein